MPGKLTPRSNKTITRSITRQRVLLSLHMHTREYDFVSNVPMRVLIEEAGVKADRIRTALRDLEQAGLIEELPIQYQRAGSPKAILLLGHPDIPSYLEFLEECGTLTLWSPDWKEEMQEYERRCAESLWRSDETREEFEIRTGQR